MRSLLAALAGFVVMFAVNGLLAALIIGPLVENRYEEVIADEPSFGLLIAGYLIIAIAMALLYPRLQPGVNSLSTSLISGTLIGGAAFLGVHTVIAGYTSIDALGFIISGAFDSLGVIAGMLAVGYVYERGLARAAAAAGR